MMKIQNSRVIFSAYSALDLAQHFVKKPLLPLLSGSFISISVFILVVTIMLTLSFFLSFMISVTHIASLYNWSLCRESNSLPLIGNQPCIRKHLRGVKLVDQGRVELPIPACKAGVFPLALLAH